MDIIIIAAMTKNRVIGKDGKLPWDIPEELNMFRSLTKDSTVMMGRRTYDSIGHPLPKRNNIIVSRSVSAIEGVDVYNNIKDAVTKAKSYGKVIFIIGGSTIYKETIPIADKMFLSYIKKDYDGDTYFPEFNEDDWAIEKKEDHEEFEFVIYKRK